VAGIQNPLRECVYRPFTVAGSVRVHCLAYPVLRIGMSKGLSGSAEGPMCFGGARRQGRAAKMRRFSQFAHETPRSKRRRWIVGQPQAALAPFPHFSGSNNSSKRRLRRQPQS
jgi:hypothetical protein